jgi:hypothetical protein
VKPSHIAAIVPAFCNVTLGELATGGGRITHCVSKGAAERGPSSLPAIVAPAEKGTPPACQLRPLSGPLPRPRVASLALAGEGERRATNRAPRALRVSVLPVVVAAARPR